MKLGIMSASIAPLGWDKALEFCRHLGLDAIELPCGGYAKSKLIDAEALLADSGQQRRIVEDLKKHGLTLSAVSCHGNPVHPDAEIARAHERAQDVCVRL